MMKTEEINIRDPYVLLEGGKYYLYGTRAATCWGAAEGFDAYVSEDLREWEGPFEVFSKPEGFWGDLNAWAPEVHKHRGAYYMFATFKSSSGFGGTAVLRAEQPLGPFVPHSEGKVTPPDWECIDGTLFVDEFGVPYIVFVHEWVQISNGTICALRLSADLSRAEGEPLLLFHASEAEDWVRPITNKKRPGLHYVTDGPFMYRSSCGRLLMLWSSFGDEGYVEALAVSESGTLAGPWTHGHAPLFKKDGGHGMLFTNKEGRLLLSLHAPNEHLRERPHFYELEDTGAGLRLCGAAE